MMMKIKRRSSFKQDTTNWVIRCEKRNVFKE